MPIIIVLGIVIIVAAVALVFTSKDGAENNSDVTNLLDRLKNFFTDGMKAEGTTATTTVDKYEKSDDGKVVYAFKPKSNDAEGNDSGTGDSDADDEGGNKDA
jgi:predicted small secreted protein